MWTTWAVRVVCALYLAALTILLLAADPIAWLFGVVPDFAPPNRGVHFCAFFALAVLSAASRLPWKAPILGAVLIAYALTTESLQSLVESRTVELFDCSENLLGLAVGGIVWTLGCRLVQARRAGELPVR
jgi:hypothetical protein